MSNFEDDLPDTASVLQLAHRTYVTVHARLMQEVDQLAGLEGPAEARARQTASAAASAAAPDAGLAADAARKTAEAAKNLRDAIDRHQRALDQVLAHTTRIERMQREAGHGAGGLDLESARREILGELARLAARG